LVCCAPPPKKKSGNPVEKANTRKKPPDIIHRWNFRRMSSTAGFRRKHLNDKSCGQIITGPGRKSLEVSKVQIL
jgi:hypothetical protein